MKRFIVFVILFTAILTSSHIDPVRAESLKQRLTDTRWTMEYDYKGSHRKYDFILEESGIVKRFKSNDKTYGDDTWQLSGSILTIKINNGKVICTGEISDPNTQVIYGISKNFRHESWSWKATNELKSTPAFAQGEDIGRKKECFLNGVITEFNGMKWGKSIDSAKEKMTLKSGKSSEDSYYSYPHEGFCFDSDLIVKKVTLEFWKNSFEKVFISLALGTNRHKLDNLYDKLCSFYGAPTNGYKSAERLMMNRNFYIKWKTKKGNASLSFNAVGENQDNWRVSVIFQR